MKGDLAAYLYLAPEQVVQRTAVQNDGTVN
jgi:hypothetical protein